MAGGFCGRRPGDHRELQRVHADRVGPVGVIAYGMIVFGAWEASVRGSGRAAVVSRLLAGFC